MTTGPLRWYARGAAVAFGLVAAYTLAAKIPDGELRADWMHTAIHLATGLVAGYAGWLAPGESLAQALTVVVAVAYGTLGVAGWFLDGLLMGTPVRVPLDAAANVFHVLLAIAAVAALAASALTDVRHRGRGAARRSFG